MAAVVAEFFSIIGLEMVPPSTFSELIPYLLEVFVGISLVSGVFGIIGKIAELLMDITRWR